MLAEHLQRLLLAWSILAAALFGPGPNNLAVAGIAASQGRRVGVQMALGLVIGGMVWITVGVLGLSALLAASRTATTALVVAAGLYMLWLAARSLRFALHPPPPSIRPGTASRHRVILRGMTLSLTNPKSALTWMSVVALGLGESPPPPVAAAMVTGAAAIALGGHMTYALAFSSTPVSSVYGRWQRWIQAALALIFAYASVRILLWRG